MLIAGLLFLATCVSTFWTGMGFGESKPSMTWTDYLWYGASYAGPLMLILLCHEMGHYLQARRYRVPATLPIFIPTPPGIGFGTMGAVIVQGAGHANRKAMFDIAISGPLAGFVIAVPVAWWGVLQSKVVEFTPDKGGMHFGDPLLLQAMTRLVHGPLPPNFDVVLNPVLFAGWVGIFLTGLNLLPIGQLDGGHIMYCMLGRRAHRLAWIVMAVWVGYMVIAHFWGYLAMVLLLMMFGIRHPPTSDDRVPLGIGRIILGWATMGLLLICFSPRPVEVIAPKSQPTPERRLPREPEEEHEPLINVRVDSPENNPLS